jgi:hypothetical protein
MTGNTLEKRKVTDARHFAWEFIPSQPKVRNSIDREEAAKAPTWAWGKNSRTSRTTSPHPRGKMTEHRGNMGSAGGDTGRKWRVRLFSLRLIGTEELN